MKHHKSLVVARQLLEKLNATYPAVTPMQLIKLVYVSHGYMLGLHGRPLLDEPVEAWQYGPVVRSVYDAVRHYKSSPIQTIQAPHGIDLDDKEKEVLERVVRTYGKFDGIVLSSATHKPGTPWDMTWKMWGRNSDISNDMIEHFYRNLLAQGKHSAL